ncbi:hypothetical protein AKO1_002770 [Acrasis kona]|uniref:Uncharacterized protein n=1 Tax=Acrasis kona TaxID=1008807 RepID=A0AAW2YIF8_9EUKA
MPLFGRKKFHKLDHSEEVPSPMEDRNVEFETKDIEVEKKSTKKSDKSAMKERMMTHKHTCSVDFDEEINSRQMLEQTSDIKLNKRRGLLA